MSLEQKVANLALRLSTESKSLRTLINANQPSNAALTTAVKTNLVAAINEVHALVLALDDTFIQDAATGTGSTWSSSKITDELTDLKNDLLGGAGPAYDTLQELKALLDTVDTDADSAIAAINTALGNRVRTDTNAQGLDATQRANARTNIDVHSKAEIGNVDADFVAIFEAGLL